MKKNMGKIDRIIRLSLAIIMLGLATFMIFVNWRISIAFFLFTILLGVTSIIGTCPVYVPFYISTLGVPITPVAPVTVEQGLSKDQKEVDEQMRKKNKSEDKNQE